MGNFSFHSFVAHVHDALGIYIPLDQTQHSHSAYKVLTVKKSKTTNAYGGTF